MINPRWLRTGSDPFFVWSSRSGDATPYSGAGPRIPVRSFDRFNEILYLIENASALTLARHRRVRGVTLELPSANSASTPRPASPPEAGSV
jgi:hypothetical protein